MTEEDTGRTRFVYSPSWKEDVACCFPIMRREYEWPGLHPFFQHLGPEGWLRERQARVGHINIEDDLGLLLRYGADCIGAVSLLPLNEVDGTVGAVELTANQGRTISGMQKKLLVIKKDHQFHPAPVHGPAPYIAKFNSQEIPTLVRNEFLSLRWVSSVLGSDEVTQFDWGQVHGLDEGDQDWNKTALIVKRFDRTSSGDKLRLEDCSQILCKPKGVDYGGKYDAEYEDIAGIIMQHSVRPQIDLARFYRRLIVFALVGNCDAHLKNFSLLETPAGLRLSPAYDILNTFFYGDIGYATKLALSIGGKKRHFDEVNRQLFVNFGKEIGLPNKIIEQILNDLKRQVAKSSSIIRPPAAETPDGFITRFEEIVRNACIRILEK